MSFGKGSNTTTTNTAPNPQAMASYQGVMSRANNVASLPYTAYTGTLVADVNQQQMQGIGNINANAGFAQPYIQQASQYANNAAQPLTGDQIAQYQNPYTQQVIDATSRQFAHNNAVQQQGVLGNEVAQGALGGDRGHIAQAELSRQQNAAQDPVIAGLYSQSYQQAAAIAQQQQQNQAQAAYSLGNLGVSGQAAGLQGAGAQIGAGSLEQQTQQAQLGAQYNQFQLAQAFPYQQTQWLAGIDTGVGSNMGGQSTTVGPPPNPWNSILGLGVAGAGAYFGAANRPTAASGGRVPGFALGGTPYQDVTGFIPGMNITHGRGPPPPPGTQQQGGQGAGQSGMASAATSIGRGLGRVGNDQGSGDPLGWTIQNGRMTPTYGGPEFQTGLPPIYASGGFVVPGEVRGYEIGGPIERGYPEDDTPVRGGFGGASFVPDYTPSERVDDRWPLAGEITRSDGLAGNPMALQTRGLGYATDRMSAGEFRPLPAPGSTPVRTTRILPTSQTSGMVPPAQDDAAPTMGGGLPQEITGKPPEDDEENPSLGYMPRQSGAGGGNETVQEAQGGEGPSSGFSLPGRGLLSPEASQAMIMAGLGMMRSRSPFLGPAVGEGGVEGMQTYQAAKKQTFAEQKTKEELALKTQHYANEAKKLQDMADRYANALKEQTRQHDLKASQPTVVDKDSFGNPVYGVRDPAVPGGWLDPITRKPLVSPKTPPALSAPQAEDASIPKKAQYVSTMPAEFIEAAKKGGTDAVPEIYKTERDPGYNRPGTRPEVLEGHDPKVVANIKGMAAGEIAIPRKDQAKWTGLVKDYDPSWDQTVYQRRQRTQNSFAAGVEGRSVTAINTLPGHLAKLYELAVKLDAGNYPDLNALKQKLGWHFGNKDIQGALQEYKGISKLVGDEIAKVAAGGPSALGDRAKWEGLFDPSTPLRAQIRGIKSLIDGVQYRSGELTNTYNNGMGTNRTSMDLVSPASKRIYDQLHTIDPDNPRPLGRGSGAETSAPAAPRQRIQNGYIYQEQSDGSMKAVGKAP